MKKKRTLRRVYTSSVDFDCEETYEAFVHEEQERSTQIEMLKLLMRKNYDNI